MRVSYQSKTPTLQTNLISGPNSFFALLENVRQRPETAWEDRGDKVRERAYHLATLKSDKMTDKTAETIFDNINQDPLAMDLFVHALTGDFRDDEFMKGATRLTKMGAEITEKAIGESKANSPQENSEIVLELQRRLGYSILDFVPDETKKYLLSRLPEGFKDSKESTKDERIKFEK